MCICSTACDIKLTDMPIYFKPLIYLLTYRQKQKYVSTLLLANCKKKWHGYNVVGIHTYLQARRLATIKRSSVCIHVNKNFGQGRGHSRPCIEITLSVSAKCRFTTSVVIVKWTEVVPNIVKKPNMRLFVPNYSDGCLHPPSFCTHCTSQNSGCAYRVYLYVCSAAKQHTQLSCDPVWSLCKIC